MDAKNASIFEDIQAGLSKAEKKFPSQSLDITVIAMGEEYGEACQAYLNERLGVPQQGDDLYTEALHVAVMAIRIMKSQLD